VKESAGRMAAFKARLGVAMPVDAGELAARLGSPAHRALAAWFPRVNSAGPAASPVAGP
jgi:hypothetical protein